MTAEGHVEEVDIEGAALAEAADLFVYGWLEECAFSTPQREHVAALISGAMGGLVRFMWTVRTDDVTPTELIELIGEAITNVVQSCAKDGAGGADGPRGSLGAPAGFSTAPVAPARGTHV